MSIALDSATRVGIASPSAFGKHGGVACGLMFDTPENRRRVNAGEVEVESSSSIGNNSDDESDGCENDEAQSSYKGGPLDMMNTLEEVLPVRRGISKFYNYKSKSYTSLAEASSSSDIKEIAKPDNAYTRKRRNLLASNLVWEKNRSFPLRSNGIGGGIAKRRISSSRSALALAVKLTSCSESSTSSASEDSNSSSPRPLPPGCACPLGSYAARRSYSLADLQECAISATGITSRFSPSTAPDV